MEPVHPRHFLSPILSFFEPPPLYTESSEGACGPSLNAPRYEAPPPYTSTVDDRDTAGLIMNESSENRYIPAHTNIQTHTETDEAVDLVSEEIVMATEVMETNAALEPDNIHCSANVAVAMSAQPQNRKDSVDLTDAQSQTRALLLPRSPQHVSEVLAPPGDEPTETENLRRDESEA